MTQDDAARDSALITGKALERHFDLEDAMREFARLFRDDTNDRAMVIVGAAFIDTQLEHVIANFLVDDDKEVSALLATYSGKTRLAYCLGLVGPVILEDLRLIGKIRNTFAHDLYASFSRSDIGSWASSLRWHRMSYMTPPAGSSARDLFNVGLNQVAAHLSGIVSIARLEKRIIRRNG